MKQLEDLATLQERIALARGRAAQASSEKYTAKAQAALDEAATSFTEAYVAAESRYDKR